MMWEEGLIDQLKEQVNHYPLKALFDELLRIDQVQKERIQQLQQQVDGQPWSPSEWEH